MARKMDGFQKVDEGASEETLNWLEPMFHDAVNLVLKTGRQSKHHDQAFFEGVWEDIREGRTGKKLFIEWMKENDAAVIEDFRNKQKASIKIRV